MLRGIELTKRYGNNTVLDKVSLDVAPGSITSILGPSGGGKSTFLRLLAMLDSADSGVVELDGLSGTEAKSKYSAFAGSRKPVAAWPKVTLVFQQQFLWPHLSLEDNILLPCREQVSFENNRVEELLAALGLSHLRSQRPWQLSQGERARAALLRAFLLNPKYLLLDEATAALDSARSGVVGSLLRSCADEGTGILLVTHDLAFAARWSDQTYQLERGQLLKTDVPHQLAGVAGHAELSAVRMVPIRV